MHTRCIEGQTPALSFTKGVMNLHNVIFFFFLSVLVHSLNCSSKNCIASAENASEDSLAKEALYIWAAKLTIDVLFITLKHFLILSERIGKAEGPVLTEGTMPTIILL